MRPCARVHTAAHLTPKQSATDKKIIPPSVPECFLWHPLTRAAPTSCPHPQKTRLLSPNCDSVWPRHPNLPRLMLYKHSPVFYPGPKSVPRALRCRPITQTASPPAPRPDLRIERPQRATWPHLDESTIYLVKPTRKWPQFSSQALTSGRRQTFIILLKIHVKIFPQTRGRASKVIIRRTPCSHRGV